MPAANRWSIKYRYKLLVAFEPHGDWEYLVIDCHTAEAVAVFNEYPAAKAYCDQLNK